MYRLPQASDSAFPPGPLSQQQCAAGCYEYFIIRTEVKGGNVLLVLLKEEWA